MRQRRRYLKRQAKLTILALKMEEEAAKECGRTLEAEKSSQLIASKKMAIQSDHCRELNSANNWSELGSIFPEASSTEGNPTNTLILA